MPRAQLHLYFDFFAQHEAHASHGVQELSLKRSIDFLAQTHDLRVDDVIERRLASRFLPNIARQHFARHHSTLVRKQIFEQFEFTRSEFEVLAAARDEALRYLHFEVGQLESPLAHLRLTATQKDAGSRQQFWERERLHQIIIGPRIKTADPILHRIPRGEQQYGCSDAALTKRIQNFESIVTRQHHVQDDQIEGSGL